MGYKILKSESVEAAARRVAREQLDGGLRDLDRVGEIGADETIHRIRKRYKKLRGLVRLMRGGGLDELAYRRENTRYRDAARRLSGLRDAAALVEAYDALMARYRESVDRRAFGPVRGQLTRRREALAVALDSSDARLADARQVLEEGREAVERWRIAGDGFVAIGPGLIQTFARGRKAMKRARERPDEERLHEWRKRVKYQWYHVRLIEKAQPKRMRARRDRAKALADALGDEHDLAMFRQTLLDEPDRFGTGERVTALVGLIDRRRIELRQEAFLIGDEIYADKPKRLRRRLERAWSRWSEDAKAPGNAKSRRTAKSGGKSNSGGKTKSGKTKSGKTKSGKTKSGKTKSKSGAKSGRAGTAAA